MSYPDWYQIPEIPFDKYVECCKSLYSIIEKNKTNTGNDDPFLKNIVKASVGITDEDWNKTEKQRRYYQALSMKMGDFHEELAGKFNGWKTLKVGHSSGCDVMKEDETEFMEWKNRDNTMNSSSASSVIKKLSKLYEQDKKVFLVLVNVSKKTVPRFGAPDYIHILNGQQAYEYLSGRKTFFNHLLKTITHTFTLCATYKELLKLKEMHL